MGGWNRRSRCKILNFVVWDVEGQDEIWRMRRLDYRGIDGLVRVVDRNDRSRTRRTMRACWFPAVEQELFDAVAGMDRSSVSRLVLLDGCETAPHLTSPLPRRRTHPATTFRRQHLCQSNQKSPRTARGQRSIVCQRSSRTRSRPRHAASVPAAATAVAAAAALLQLLCSGCLLILFCCLPRCTSFAELLLR